MCSWQQRPGRVVMVSYEPCMWHLKDPPVPCNPGNLLVRGREKVSGVSQATGLASQPWSHIPLCTLESVLK